MTTFGEALAALLDLDGRCRRIGVAHFAPEAVHGRAVVVLHEPIRPDARPAPSRARRVCASERSIYLTLSIAKLATTLPPSWTLVISSRLSRVSIPPT